MKLSLAEQARLMIFTAAEVVRRWRDRGLKLNYRRPSPPFLSFGPKTVLPGEGYAETRIRAMLPILGGVDDPYPEFHGF